ncbi:MAG: ribonuclease E/G [Rickettsiales bacterium]|nr:ribonuclease E/G [Rickettsiales bacterium]
MTKRMLIDAVHPEDIRVVVAEDTRLEEFDFETAAKKQIKGNIYLVKVTRVEPSLQAAFVEYGGNKQGFLPFAEIHPDYYQIPVADKQALLKEAAEEAAEAEDEDEPAAAKRDTSKKQTAVEARDEAEGASPEEGDEAEAEAPPVDSEELEADDGFEQPKHRPNFYRRYKIQEVIKRNQILLAQVIKEERGTKGASLTTYISLPGRYCVLMPNSQKAGGVSRRIADRETRKRLKSVVSELELGDGMSVIIRTAGIDRKKPEIKRDCTYLVKLWNTIRESAVQMNAPALVNEEGDIIRRSLRDIYHNDIEEVLVEGDEALKNAREFMKLMMPSHAKRIKEYKENIPLFQKFQIEDELDQLHNNTVSLKSGGSVVLSPTEALVSIDVNSGRSTREHNIEETALKTNLEAAEEIARQLRLRDLAGLVVIDFIDMMEYRNRRTIERALKEALKSDRAKIQVGRISNFGLLEMSRQRLRSSLMESNAQSCPMCRGTGLVRAQESVAMMHLRALENAAHSKKFDTVVLRTSFEAAHYLLNHRRDDLSSLEEESGTRVTVLGDSGFIGESYVIERPRAQNNANTASRDEQRGNRRQRRRGGDNRRGGRNERQERQSVGQAREQSNTPPVQETEPQDISSSPVEDGEMAADQPDGRTDRRRRRRGGRNRRGGDRQNQGNQKQNYADGNKTPANDAPKTATPEPFPVSKEPARPFAVAETRHGDEHKSVLRGLWKKITE